MTERTATDERNGHAMANLRQHGLDVSDAIDRRETVRSVLDDRSKAVALDELVRFVIDRESGRRTGDIIDRDATTIELHHVHLPAMDERGVIEYDRDRRVIEPIQASQRRTESDGSYGTPDGNRQGDHSNSADPKPAGSVRTFNPSLVAVGTTHRFP